MSIPPMLYQVFGGCLGSDLEFPNLPPAPASAVPTWRLQVLDAPAPERETTVLKAEPLSAELTVTIASMDAGLRVTYSDTGVYDLLDESTVVWYRTPGVDVGDVRLDVLGTLLTLSLHLHGRLTLHGSAVAFESGVIAFLAPSGFGKSTLAMSLTVAGARFMSDDAVPVRVEGDRAIASPGVPSPRFREDSFARFRDVLSAPVGQGGGKMSASAHLAHDVVQGEDGRLSAVYVLAPVAPGEGARVQRTRLPELLGTMELLRNAKLAKLLWAEENERLFALVADVARQVPVWKLEVPRDLELLPSVVEQLIAWHGPAYADLA